MSYIKVYRVTDHIGRFLRFDYELNDEDDKFFWLTRRKFEKIIATTEAAALREHLPAYWNETKRRLIIGPFELKVDYKEEDMVTCVLDSNNEEERSYECSF